MLPENSQGCNQILLKEKKRKEREKKTPALIHILHQRGRKNNEQSPKNTYIQKKKMKKLQPLIPNSFLK